MSPDPNKVGPVYSRLASIQERLEEGFIALLLVIMVLITFTQVILRYFFGTGLLWAVELTSYLFGWLVLFGASYVLKKRGHIGVDALVKLLPPWLARRVELIAVALCLFYTAIMCVGGYRYVATMYVIGLETEDMAIKRWVLLSIIPIGMILLFVRFLQIGWGIATNNNSGVLIADEIADELVVVAGIRPETHEFEGRDPTK